MKGEIMFLKIKIKRPFVDKFASAIIDISSVKLIYVVESELYKDSYVMETTVGGFTIDEASYYLLYNKLYGEEYSDDTRSNQ